MIGELDVLRIVSERLDRIGVSYMLTGSFALAWYATPRMTRDIDLVVAIRPLDVSRLIDVFVADFYVDEETARKAVASSRMFNLMHLESGIKVDLIVRKGDEYRMLEFDRRMMIELDGFTTWIVSREDLILSKLVWAKDSGSELQQRDVRSLLDPAMDLAYLRHWAERLGVAASMEGMLT